MNTVVEERQVDTTGVVAAASSAAVGAAAGTVADMPKEFLTFRLGGEEYGIDILARAGDPQL
jgi:purine-binding chemotaxis protein CheW